MSPTVEQALFIAVLIWFLYKLKCKSQHKMLQQLARQAYRWYGASVQDISPAVRLLHINYAVAYADSMELLATPSRIKMATGLDYHMFKTAILAQQDLAMLLLYSKCPELISDDPAYRDYVKNLKHLHDTKELRKLLSHESVPAEFRKLIIEEANLDL